MQEVWANVELKWFRKGESCEQLNVISGGKMIIATLIADFHEAGFQQLYFNLEKFLALFISFFEYSRDGQKKNVKNHDHILLQT